LHRYLAFVPQQCGQRGDVALQLGVVGAGADGAAERVGRRDELPGVNPDYLRRRELRVGDALADGGQVVDGRLDRVEVLHGVRLVPGAGGDARGVIDDGAGGAVRGVLRLPQRTREGAAIRPVGRVRDGVVELVFQRLAEVDQRGVELREVLHAPGRLPVVDVGVDSQRAEHGRGQGRDRDDGGQAPADAPIDQ